MIGKCVKVILLLLSCYVYASPDALVDQAMLDDDKLILLEQNWSAKDRHFFYFTSQGSKLIDYNLFLHLEQSDSTELFRANDNLMRYGIIPLNPSPKNPDGLPIGFVVNDKTHIGLTCAACHTQLIKYQGNFIRIDGGQSMMDLQKFSQALEKALANTIRSTDKYSRLEQRILGDKPSTRKRNQLKVKLEQAHDKQYMFNYRNQTVVDYGYSRLDAFGVILNKAAFLTEVKDNFNTPNAPTSYPYLWDTPQHDYVEWNGSQSNSSLGAFARNVGEFIGVFGEVIPKKRKLFFYNGGYQSSVKAANIRKLERVIAKLQSPTWPLIFPSINYDKAQQGRRLYEQYCISCHLDIDRSDPNRLIKVRMSTLNYIKTDPVMVQNVIRYHSKSGIFKGEKRFYQKGGVMGDTTPTLYLANHLMVGVLKNNPINVLLAKRDAKSFGHDPKKIHPPKYVDNEIIEQGKEVSDHALLAYKARPLNGIWAGAPYLHNGSVANLYDLLQPAEKRPQIFYIGSWEFDSVRVGYVSDKPQGFLFDTKLVGNSNAGHEYGTGYDGKPKLTEKEIWALVEYLKTL